MQTRLPSFIIIGAQKAGTTSLYSYLGRHPDVELPANKEIHFFDNKYDRGMAWYLDQFPAGLPEGKITGEASPYYLFHPLAAERVARECPEVRLIVLLRDPVERAYSHYMMERRVGNEPLATFGEALAAEPQRLQGEADRIIRGECRFNFNHQIFSYASRGLYAVQLTKWLEFFPPDRLLVLKSEEFFSHPGDVLLRVHSFLELQPCPSDNLQPENTGTYDAMEPETRQRLRDFFREDSQRLAELVGPAFSWEG